MSEALPALSIRQPWAELILRGEKRVELRSWSTAHRGPLWLHTGRSTDRQAAARLSLGDLFTGGYVGSVRLVAVVPMDPARWAEWTTLHLAPQFTPGLYGWLLADPVRFRRPIAASGSQRLFYASHDLELMLLKEETIASAAR